MSTSTGLLETFRTLARIPAAGRPALRPRTIDVYASHVLAFWRFTDRKRAAQWTGRDVSRWMFHLDAEGYAPKSRGQALCRRRRGRSNGPSLFAERDRPEE